MCGNRNLVSVYCTVLCAVTTELENDTTLEIEMLATYDYKLTTTDTTL